MVVEGVEPIQFPIETKFTDFQFLKIFIFALIWYLNFNSIFASQRDQQ